MSEQIQPIPMDPTAEISSREEVYNQIKKREKWLRIKRKPNSLSLEKFYSDDQPYNNGDNEEDYDHFFVDDDGSEHLVFNNLGFLFVKNYLNQYIPLAASVGSELGGKIIKEEEIREKKLEIIDREDSDLVTLITELSEEKEDLKKKVDWESINRIDNKLTPLLERAYLILREHGYNPEDIRR